MASSTQARVLATADKAALLRRVPHAHCTLAAAARRVRGLRSRRACALARAVSGPVFLSVLQKRPLPSPAVVRLAASDQSRGDEALASHKFFATGP